MHYIYRARDGEGKIVKGEIEAADETGAVSSLRENGLFISAINPKTESKFDKFAFFNKTSLKDKIIFTQQLGIMIKSGLSVVEAMKALAEETTNKKFAAEINQVISDVKGGTQLSEALAKHPRTFDTVYVHTVSSGEKSGKLEEVLARLATQLEKDYELTSKIRGALIYPTFVLGALIAVFVLVLVAVIPELKKIFDEMDVPLPAITRAVIGLSTFMKNNIILMVIALVVIIVALKFFGQTPSGRRIFDQIKMKIPVLGSLTKKSYMAKFCRTFAGLSAAGLPLLDIFRTAKDVINNVIYQEAIDVMTKKVENGEPISKVLKDCKLFPAMVGQLASVGEKSGSIDTVFDTLANFFDREVDNIAANLSQMLEPILMVIMGVGVGILIISVVQPIYGLVNVI
jgi:type IV pilus assembly protein PilC